MPEPTLQSILDAVNSVGTKLSIIEAQVHDLRSDRDDHEARLRGVEQRTDEGRRIDGLEIRVNQHDRIMTSHVERIGRIESDVPSIKKQVEQATLDLKPRRIDPIALVGVLVAASAIILTLIFKY